MPDDEWKDFKRKKKIKAWVAKAVGSVGRLPILDAIVGTKFARNFEGVTASRQTLPYLNPKEFKDDDEPQIIEALIQTFVDDTTEDDDIPEGIAQSGGSKLNSNFQDPHWGHTTGHLYGELEIDNIDHLHEHLQVGLFKRKGRYDVYCRPNFLYDPSLPIAINRLSLKLKMPIPVPNVYSPDKVAHELDLLLSEGLPAGDNFEPDGQGFFFRDARQLLMANEMKDGLFSLAKVLFDKTDARVAREWKTKIFDQNTNMLYRGYQTHLTWDKRWYYSAGPYRLGPGAMKFALEPSDPQLGDDIEIFAKPDMEAQPSEADYHPSTAHAETFNRLDEDTSIKFTLKVQVASEAAIPEPKDGDPPKSVMAAEYTDISWDTKHAPFVPVGTLTLRPHRVDMTDPENRWYAMGFNAWNTFDEMAPLGQLFRARREVHKAHREARLKHSFADPDTSPTLGKCPFTPRSK